MEASAGLQRLTRKLNLLFSTQLICDASDWQQALRSSCAAPQLMAYGLNFSREFLKLGDAFHAAHILDAYTRARRDEGLPDDRSAGALRIELSRALVEMHRTETVSLQEKARSPTAGKADKLAAMAAGRKLHAAREDLRRGEQALAEYSVSTSALPEQLPLQLSSLSLHTPAPQLRTAAPLQSHVTAAQCGHGLSLAGQTTRASPLVPNADDNSVPPSVRFATPTPARGRCRARVSFGSPQVGGTRGSISEYISESLSTRLGSSPTVKLDGSSAYNLGLPAGLPTPPTSAATRRASLDGAVASTDPGTTAGSWNSTRVGASGRAWEAGVLEMQKRSERLRKEAEAMLQALPAHCRSGALPLAERETGHAVQESNPLTVERWMYSYLLYEPWAYTALPLGGAAATGESEVGSVSCMPRPLAAADHVWLLDLSDGTADVVQIKIRLFSEAVPATIHLLQDSLDSKRFSSARGSKRGGDMLELSLAPLQPAARKTASEKASALQVEQQRLEHCREELVSMYMPDATQTPKLALCLGAKTPFVRDGCVVGRMVGGQDQLAQFLSKGAKKASDVSISGWRKVPAAAG